ncbi:MOSC domain-containing protein [Pseudodonghicola xiamenensis]|uniref:Molybdenum cofactor sulfurase n=1 Tax=Pseudodonghicola xiamenensis TaxID=337702 RepID=A0A8J3H6C4_9RHOB|nr:sulfurase [Pseudodonghicola xiamenensis]GHG84171.1 molybdenum cofactor sulfurase [Pseudodonghicola xiamenensis]
MAALVKTEFEAEVIWLGHVPAAGRSLRARSAERLELGFDGLVEDRHGGAVRPSCSRVLNLYPRNTKIRNVRQLSILSEEELGRIAEGMGMERLEPALLGATMVLRGIPDFTHVPPSSRLQAAGGLTLTVDMENLPCVLPGREIEAEEPGRGAAFKPAAAGLRGVTAWVERPGALAVGDRLGLFIPAQRAWQSGSNLHR